MALYLLLLFMVVLVALLVHEHFVGTIRTIKDGLLLFGAYGSEILLLLLLLKILVGAGAMDIEAAFCSVTSVFRYGLMGGLTAIVSPLLVSLVKDMIQKEGKNTNEENVV